MNWCGILVAVIDFLILHHTLTVRVPLQITRFLLLPATAASGCHGLLARACGPRPAGPKHLRVVNLRVKRRPAGLKDLRV